MVSTVQAQTWYAKLKKQEEEGIACIDQAIARYNKLQKQEEQCISRINIKEQDLNRIMNELYQIVGFFFVFEGVLLQGVSQAAKVKYVWVPMTISLVALGAASIGVVIKLWEKQKCHAEIEKDKSLQQAIIVWADKYDGTTEDAGFDPLLSMPVVCRPSKRGGDKDYGIFFMLILLCTLFDALVTLLLLYYCKIS